jgi:hypothetical protein
MAIRDDRAEVRNGERWERLTELLVRSWRRQLMERRETDEGSATTQG